MVAESPIKPGTVWLSDMFGWRNEKAFQPSDEMHVDAMSRFQAGVGSICRRPANEGWEYGIAVSALNDPEIYGSRELLQAQAVAPILEERLPSLLRDFGGLDIGLGVEPDGGATLSAFVSYESPLLHRIADIHQAMVDIEEHCFQQIGDSPAPGM